LDQEQEWFRHTGTLHLFAVSGLNLAMLGVFLSGLARLFCVGPRVAALGVVPLLTLYALVTGGSPSCVRALVMSVMGVMVCWIGRPARALNSLGTAAFLLLLWDGNVLFRPAFQLSFWLVVVLASLVHPIARIVRRWAEPDPLLPRVYWTTPHTTRIRLWRPVADAAAVSVAAWGASLPAAVFLFHEITPVALLANLLLTPLAFCTLALGFLALFASPLGWIFHPASVVTPALNQINGLCANGVLGIVRFCGALPGAHSALADPWRRVPEFTVFDVGEGAAVMVRCGSSTVLLDCGREEQVRRILQPALRLYGIGALDLWLLSHGDVNHVGGGRLLLEELPVRGVVLPLPRDRSMVRRRLEEWLLQRPLIHTQRVSAGWKCDVASGGTLEVLYPPPDVRASLSDDRALVVRWSSPQGSLLYTADAGFPTELWLLSHCADKLASDIWVRGHHDRERTGLDDFVRMVSPRVIVLGYSGMKGRPASDEQWAQKWIREGKAVFFQKKSGAVEGFWRGNRWEVRGFCGGEASFRPAAAEGPSPREAPRSR
jgi:ComEC/Rec2-related protein